MFVSAFVFVIVLQSVGMIMHRFKTLAQIVATTNLITKTDDLENVVDIVKVEQQQLEDDGSKKTLTEVYFSILIHNPFDILFRKQLKPSKIFE